MDVKPVRLRAAIEAGQLSNSVELVASKPSFNETRQKES